MNKIGQFWKWLKFSHFRNTRLLVLTLEVGLISALLGAATSSFVVALTTGMVLSWVVSYHSYRQKVRCRHRLRLLRAVFYTVVGTFPLVLGGVTTFILSSDGIVPLPDFFVRAAVLAVIVVPVVMAGNMSGTLTGELVQWRIIRKNK